MRRYEEKKVENILVELVETTCDLCTTVAKAGHWDSSSYEIAETEIEVTVRQKDGSTFPEGGSGTAYNVDMCPECFKTKLIPWLESQGCTAKRADWDY